MSRSLLEEGEYEYDADDCEKLIDDPEDPYSCLGNGDGGGKDGGGGTVSSRPWHIIRIPFRHFIRIVISLPLGAFVFCVFWALYTNYEVATTALCARENNRPVRNYLPSLSSATGDFIPSQYIWKACIIIHAPGRFLFASMYLKYLRKTLLPQYTKWAFVAWFLHVLEILGLVGLTLITSKQNLFIHAVNFATFIICSELYMILLCILMSPSCRKTELNRLEQKGLVLKKLLTKIAIICSCGLFFVYFWHEMHCGQGVYTVFAILEYSVVLSNIAFNGSAYWDFYDRIVVFDFFNPCTTPVYRYSWQY